jgi:hypothetical protein
MVPTASADGQLSSLTLNGANVSYTTQTVKGLEYALFTTAAGTYSARYAAAPAAAPAISAMSADTADQGTVAVGWRTSAPATTELAWGESAGALDHRVVVADATREHRLELPGLTPGALYWFRVTSRDAAGRETSFPPVGQLPYAFRIPDWLALPPVIYGVRAAPMPDGTASVQWSTVLRADGELQYGTSPTALTQSADASGFGNLHTVSVRGLAPATRYYYRVVSRTAWGVPSNWPVLSFVTPEYGVADSRLAEWQMGEASGVDVTARGDGELRLAAGRNRGTFVSRPLDAEQMVAWKQALWDADVPSGASLAVQLRTGSTAPPDATWTPWIDVPRQGALSGDVAASRYLQYRLTLTGALASPVVRAIGVTSTGHAVAHPSETGG